MRLIVPAAAAAILLCAVPAAAASWRLVETTDLTPQIFIDDHGIEVQGSMRIVRSRLHFKIDDAEGKVFQLSTAIYDCNNPRYSTRRMIITYDDGRQARNEWDTDQWDPINPKTVAATLQREACARR